MTSQQFKIKQNVEIQAQNSELTKEKSRLTERINTLEAGNERFVELKESQDQEVRNLNVLLKVRCFQKSNSLIKLTLEEHRSC